VKIGGNWGRSGRILTANELDLTFWVPNYGAKFHQNRVGTATPGEVTDCHFLILGLGLGLWFALGLGLGLGLRHDALKTSVT